MAKPVVVNIPHDLGRDEAKRRLVTGFGRIREQIGGKAIAFEERWEGECLHFAAGAFGQKLNGRAEILDASVRIEVDLPWVLASIAESLQGRIRKAGTLLLEKK
ncbi:MAG TPA: polyhydroxyalkanoic acid system family protein [Propylenella sp.]|jgi:hypothetical protein